MYLSLTFNITTEFIGFHWKDEYTKRDLPYLVRTTLKFVIFYIIS